jgi:hypothetical protein
MSIIKNIKLEPTQRKVQIHTRRDGEKRYVVNLPKPFMDRVMKEYNKDGVYAIDCLKLLIVDGKYAYIEIDESKVM